MSWRRVRKNKEDVGKRGGKSYSYELMQNLFHISSLNLPG
ncbi:hypothetical protein Pgin02_01848 [Porphyromonas gingivalis]